MIIVIVIVVSCSPHVYVLYGIIAGTYFMEYVAVSGNVVIHVLIFCSCWCLWHGQHFFKGPTGSEARLEDFSGVGLSG